MSDVFGSIVSAGCVGTQGSAGYVLGYRFEKNSIVFTVASASGGVDHTVVFSPFLGDTFANGVKCRCDCAKDKYFGYKYIRGSVSPMVYNYGSIGAANAFPSVKNPTLRGVGCHHIVSCAMYVKANPDVLERFTAMRSGKGFSEYICGAHSFPVYIQSSKNILDMSIKSKFLNLYNALMAEEVNGQEVSEPIQKTIIIPGDEERKVLVTIGDQVKDVDGNVIPDGVYDVDGESLVLVITDGKGELKAREDVPSDGGEVVQGDVSVELADEDKEGKPEDEKPEDTPDEPAEEKADDTKDDGIEKLLGVIDELIKRVAALEDKVSASDSKVDEVKGQVENFAKVTPSKKVAAGPYQQFADLFK